MNIFTSKDDYLNELKFRHYQKLIKKGIDRDKIHTLFPEYERLFSRIEFDEANTVRES